MMDALLGYLMHMFDTAHGCYVLASIMASLMVLLHFVAERRTFTRHEWRCVFLCLPIVNLIVFAYLVLDAVSEILGKPIVIGRKR